ncbi:hypothetical protein [Halorussus halobius]|uniref:hypothetical protein n=1 Tax=Halorussus halobius TaxID=1710537 RepID=UPI001B2FFD98|nr:hypothetical protein [Halorussus halobius]
MTGDELSLEEQVAQYCDQHPDASTAEIAGVLNAAPPAVAEVLDEPTTETPDGDQAASSADRVATEPRLTGDWADADFTDPESGVWPPELLEREQWMGHVDKKPFAPWGDRDHPEADPGEDARWKWGLDENYVDGETVAMAEVDDRLDGRAFLQQEDDPYVYVDGDDVRDRDTGEVHPAFKAILEHLGLTYADVSQSGAGVHAQYRGELPEGVKQAAWQLDDEPWGDNDELPSIEIYPGKRVCVATGEHVPGTPTEIREWTDDVLDPLLEANDDVASSQRDTPSTDREDYDLDDYEPEATSATETTDDIRDIITALDRLDARRVADRTIVHRWNDDASTSDDYRAFAPTWGRSSNGTANIVNRQIWQDTGDEGGYGGPVVMALIDAGEMSHRNASPRRARGELWFKGIEHLRDLGFDIPELATTTPDRQASATQWDVEECEPPVRDAESFDREERWAALEGERYDEFLDATGPVIFGDDAGAGKTTNAARAAATRDRPHAVLFDKHEKAREFIKDDATPDNYFHLKGGAQMRDPVCMDADHADEDCPTHPNGDCDHMCPVYDLGRDHPDRELYDALVAELDPVRTHRLLGDALPGHEEDGSCPWLDQFAEVSSAERIVGVHEYQTLKTIRNPANGPNRDVLIDETPGSLRSEQDLSVEDLVRLGNALEGIGNYAGAPDVLSELAAFAHRLVDALTDPNGPSTLDAIDPPAVEGERITVEVDPDDLPEDVDPDDVEQTTKKEFKGMPGEGYRKRTCYVVERELVAEPLAEAKLEYNETVLKRMREDDWNGEPLAVDALLAAAIAAGVPSDQARKAITAPDFLEHCPRCGGDLTHQDGGRVCDQEDGCGWDERTDFLVGKTADPARASAYLHADIEDGAYLTYESLPLVSDLPSKPLVLDATAVPQKVAGLYGVPTDHVEVTGDEPLDANLQVTQVLNGQYHWSTLKQTESLRERVERAVEKLATVHDNLLVVGRQEAREILDIPESVEWLHYHAARGLNRTECDAVVCLGAPHANVEDLEREAALLAQDHDDLRVGGTEHSTRRDCSNPPVYRKLLYEDDHGRGRAVPTKHYTGLVGELFEETREKELEQVIHRIRPLLADETKHAYLLTNVPTDVSVDEVCQFEELADPLHALLPVADRALDLADVIASAGEGNSPDGFRAETLIETTGGDATPDGVEFNIEAIHRLAQLHGLDVTERTVRRWVADLEAIGLLDAGAYEQRSGVVYTAEIATLTQALSVLTGNDSVEVALTRRLRALVEESESLTDWLPVAREVFGLSGDRHELDGGLAGGGTTPDPG